MADSVYVPEISIRSQSLSDSSRRSALVRITHWINALSFFGLLVSGAAILISHPRLYWGETGNIETPSLIDLPLPFILAGQNGWGRYLHFLAAWVCVLNGSLYVISGIVAAHFRRNLLPAHADFNRKSFAAASSLRRRHDEPLTYNILQRLAYSTVVFLLFPLVIWTGLAMSPAITSVFPALVTILGGQQSARTIHFFVSAALALFLLGHVAMVCVTGFRNNLRSMITGRSTARKGDA